MRARPEGNWLAEVSELPASEFVDAIRAVGFSALVLDQRALSPKISEIQAVFSQRAATETFSDTDGTQVATILRTPPSPTARAFIQNNGWSVLEQDGQQRWTWSSDRPTFALSPAPAGAGTCEVTIALSSIKPMNVRIHDEHGHTFADLQLKPDAVAKVRLNVAAATRHIVLENDVPAIRASEGDSRMIALRWIRTEQQGPLCRYL